MLHDSSSGTQRPQPISFDQWVMFELGALQTSKRDLERRVGERESDHKSLKSEVEKLRTWAERAAILAILYLIGGGLIVGAPTLGPLVAIAVRTLIGVRPG